jgi:putative transposase
VEQGYGAFSVSRSSIEDVENYIERQEEHHRKLTFQDEFIALLKKHGIPYDERYLGE